MTDISDLHGIYPSPLRWNAEVGVLGRGIFDEVTGERTIVVIEFGSGEAKFVLDLATRERGYGLIRAGVYDMRLSPVGVAAPEWPGDEFKPAIGCWLWNSLLGEVRLESNQSTLVRVVSAVWDRCRTFKEAATGLQPVIHFVDRVEHHYKSIGKSFWAPVINVIGWVERGEVPALAVRAPTVKPPLAIDSQVSFALLEDHKTLREDRTALQKRGVEKLEKPPREKETATSPSTTGDFIDDELPFNL